MFSSHPPRSQRITAASPCRSFAAGHMMRRQGEAEEMLCQRSLNAALGHSACLDVLSLSVCLIFWLALVLRLDPPRSASGVTIRPSDEYLKCKGVRIVVGSGACSNGSFGPSSRKPDSDHSARRALRSGPCRPPKVSPTPADPARPCARTRDSRRWGTCGRTPCAQGSAACRPPARPAGAGRSPAAQ